MREYRVIGDSSGHNLPDGTIVSPCDPPNEVEARMYPGVQWYTQGIVGDDVAIDPDDLEEIR